MALNPVNPVSIVNELKTFIDSTNSDYDLIYTAPPGTAASSALWRAVKVTYTSSAKTTVSKVEYAQNNSLENANFIFEYDERDSYTYGV